MNRETRDVAFASMDRGEDESRPACAQPFGKETVDPFVVNVEPGATKEEDALVDAAQRLVVGTEVARR